jgi:hypothetical protein
MPNFLFEIKTKKCIVPSTQLEAYSELPAVQFYDWLRHPEGKNLRKSRINTASFVTAEGVCGELVSGVARYTAHPAIEDQDTADVEKLFALLCDGMFFFSQNQWYLVMDRPAASSATYTDSHIAAFEIGADGSRSELPPPEGWREDPFDRVNQIVIEHTDTANGWKLIPKRYPATLPAGTHPRPATYRFPELHDPSVVQRKLIFLYNSYKYDFKLKVRHMGSTADRQIGEVITQSVASRGISAQLFRLARRQKLPDNTFDDLLLEYNADRYSNDVSTAPAKIASSLPGLAAPPNVDSGTVTFTEVPFQQQDGTWRTRGVLGLTLPLFTFFDAIEVFVSINGGTQYKWFETTSAASLTPVLFETGTYTLTLKVRHKVTAELSSGTAVAVAVNGMTGTPPDVVDFITSTTEPGQFYCAAPKDRVLTQFGSAFWSHVNLTSFDGTKVNNGNTSDVPFTDAVSNLSNPLTYYSDAGLSGPWTQTTEPFHVDSLKTWAEASPATRASSPTLGRIAIGAGCGPRRS